MCAANSALVNDEGALRGLGSEVTVTADGETAEADTSALTEPVWLLGVGFSERASPQADEITRANVTRMDRMTVICG